jgi:SAM-dependent methyltransferase
MRYGGHVHDLEAEWATAALQPVWRSGLRILSAGTGYGCVEKQVLKNLAGPRPAAMVCLDIVQPALREFLAGCPEARVSSSLAGVVCDASLRPFDDGPFDIVVSFGRASLGSYRRVAPEVARVTRPGGTVLFDFISHLSPYRWIANGGGTVRRLAGHAGLAGGTGVYPDFGPVGIRTFYQRLGLELQKLDRVAAAPPLRHGISREGYGRLERWCRPMGMLCDRVLLGRFVKRTVSGC